MFKGPRPPVAPPIPAATLDVLRSGVWVGVSSSNVEAWRVRRNQERYIEVEFFSGSRYRYGNCTILDAIQFSLSPSPGRFVWYVFRMNPQHYPFTIIRQPNRSTRVNPQTGRGYIVFGPRKAWRFRRKSTGQTIRSPKRPWP